MTICGTKFSFDGISCDKYGLMMYELSDNTLSDGAFAGTVSIIDEPVVNGYKPIFYGIQYEKKLEFQIVFGVDMDRVDAGEYITADEMNNIATWLIGHDKYKILTIDQPGFENIRFKCIITGLEQISYGNIPWALKATVTCDSPYAYRSPTSFRFQIDGVSTIEIENASGHNGYYRPVIEFNPTNGGDLIIVNKTDNDRIVEFKGIPAAVLNMTLDSETLVIENSADLNLYDIYNKKGFRLKRGRNTLVVTGKGELVFHCEFPINVCG